MSDRRAIVLDAAVRVFLRYGVKRATMNDIAEKAGISRQTLYNLFSGKTEVLSTVIETSTADAIARIDAQIETAETLDQQLDLVFDEMVLKPFDLLAQSPNAADIIEGMNGTAREALETCSQDYVALLVRILSPHGAALSAAGHEVAELAEFIQVSAYGAKKVARDRAQMVAVLATLKALILGALAA